MDEVTHVAEQIADGNLTVAVKERSEQDKLMQALKLMIEKLIEVVTNVQGGAGQVATGSQEMSAKSELISQGASEQAASAEEVSSSMEQMTSNIMQNADNAQQTEKIAVKSAEDAREGGSAVAETVTAMKEIANKISIIEEIARQTNMLALNAAIEAARAGEHGRGFAVVADEVRKLAERTTGATSEVSGIIKEIQNKVNSAVSSIGHVSAKVDKGVDLSTKAGVELTTIVAGVEELHLMVQQIASAIEEMSSTSDQISKDIESISGISRETSKSSDEVLGASTELSGQAASLQDIARQFEV